MPHCARLADVCTRQTRAVLAPDPSLDAAFAEAFFYCPYRQRIEVIALTNPKFAELIKDMMRWAFEKGSELIAPQGASEAPPAP